MRTFARKEECHCENRWSSYEHKETKNDMQHTIRTNMIGRRICQTTIGPKNALWYLWWCGPCGYALFHKINDNMTKANANINNKNAMQHTNTGRTSNVVNGKSGHVDLSVKNINHFNRKQEKKRSAPWKYSCKYPEKLGQARPLQKEETLQVQFTPKQTKKTHVDEEHEETTALWRRWAMQKRERTFKPNVESPAVFIVILDHFSCIPFIGHSPVTRHVRWTNKKSSKSEMKVWTQKRRRTNVLRVLAHKYELW